MKLAVFGSDARRQARLVAQLDNLGKGASGEAVQNLNLMLGLDEAAGLPPRASSFIAPAEAGTGIAGHIARRWTRRR